MNINKLSKLQLIVQRNFHTTLKCRSSVIPPALHYTDRDPGPDFLRSDVQKRLSSMTQMRLEKVFRRRSVPNTKISYKFMTTEEIEAEVHQIAETARNFLQMPPIVKVLEDKHQIISHDPALKDFSDSPYVFTDITYGLSNINRKIVIRHVDGTLESAPQSVRKRINQVYFPLEGRTLKLPKLFEKEYFEQNLINKNYEFILDRVCIQFEPNEKEFHDFTSQVYLRVNEIKDFEDLRSTRHFGPMTFFLAWHKMIDDLLMDMIKRDFLQNGVELITLMYDLNGMQFNKELLMQFPEEDEVQKQYKPIKTGGEEIIEETVGKTLRDFELSDKCFEYIAAYAKTDSAKKPQLELVLQTYREMSNEKRKLFEGLHKAHGVNQ